MPGSADKFVWCETVERLQSAAEVVGADELLEMATKLLVVVVVVPLDGRFLDGPVHPLDLTIGPGMIDFGEAMLDVVLAATHLEHVGDEPRCWSIGIALWKPELDAVVGQHRVDA